MQARACLVMDSHNEIGVFSVLFGPRTEEKICVGEKTALSKYCIIILVVNSHMAWRAICTKDKKEELLAKAGKEKEEDSG